MRLRVGLIFTAPGITGDEQHPCVLLTDDLSADEQVIVNLTDHVNIVGHRVDIPAGTNLSVNFQVKKRSTVHYAFAQRYGTQILEDLLGDTRARLYGVCDQIWLDRFRLELFESEDTPPAVIRYCEDLNWGL
jgi:hypothetical protein